MIGKSVTVISLIAMIWGAFNIAYGIFLAPFVVLALILTVPGEIKERRRINKIRKEGYRLIAEGEEYNKKHNIKF